MYIEAGETGEEGKNIVFVMFGHSIGGFVVHSYFELQLFKVEV